MEHYFSHLWDMRALEFDTPCDLHGIQCGVATLLCLRIYRYIAGIIPDRKKARAFTESFSIREWNKTLTEFLGKSAGVLVQLEKEEHKYDILSHRKRLDIIAGHWDEILRVISEELPSLEETEKYMQKLNMPTRPEELGHSGNDVRNTFLISKDIRNKYIGSNYGGNEPKRQDKNQTSSIPYQSDSILRATQALFPDENYLHQYFLYDNGEP
jgi:glycerol-1-phosphate dehydrogenase [NAD(P)+]